MLAERSAVVITGKELCEGRIMRSSSPSGR